MPGAASSGGPVFLPVNEQVCIGYKPAPSVIDENKLNGGLFAPLTVNFKGFSKFEHSFPCESCMGCSMTTKVGAVIPRSQFLHIFSDTKPKMFMSLFQNW